MLMTMFMVITLCRVSVILLELLPLMMMLMMITVVYDVTVAALMMRR